MGEIINLKKGQTIDLRKNKYGVDTYDLSSITIGLGWDIRAVKQGFFANLLGAKKDSFDLDAVAFCLDKHGKVANLGKEINFTNGQKLPLQKGDVIYFNNLSAPSGNFNIYKDLSKSEAAQKVQQLIQNKEYIIHTGDNLTGEGDGDDEQVIVQLQILPEKIDRIVFIVCIYKGLERKQHFGMIENAFIRAVDAKGVEIARFDLSGEETANKCTVTFAEVYRKNENWKFRAIGETHETDLFIKLLKQYL